MLNIDQIKQKKMDPESNSNLSSSSDDQEQPAKKEKSPIKVHLNKPML